ncbi:MAG: SufD family Fe-S cluster assembly protein [Bacilli bacterium]|nr:SufD family Fe-S cluster assembly protein [Bacilli bacterium]
MKELVANSINQIRLEVQGCETYGVDVTCGPLHFDIVVKENASLRLEIIRIKNPVCSASIDGRIDLRKNAHLEVVMVDFNKEDINVDLHSDLQEGSKATYKVAVTSSGHAKKVYNFHVFHLDPHTTSFVKMAGVLTDEAELHFLGTSDIFKGSIKAKTRQEGRIADLSTRGKAEVSPILNIDENDVVASHGAALGKVPDASLFYLMSRGLTKKEATSLLTVGYLKPFVMEISDTNIRNRLLGYVEERGFIDD